MALFGNLIWLILGGFAIGGLYLLGAVILFPLLPFLWPLVKYSFWPFGRRPVSKKIIDQYKKANNMELDKDDFASASKNAKLCANIIWAPTFGLLLFIIHLIAGIVNLIACIIIITIPICYPHALAHFKLMTVSFSPFGVRLIPSSLADDIEKESAKAML